MFVAMEADRGNGFDNKIIGMHTNRDALKKFVESYVFERSDSCHVRKSIEGFEWEETEPHNNNDIMFIEQVEEVGESLQYVMCVMIQEVVIDLKMYIWTCDRGNHSWERSIVVAESEDEARKLAKIQGPLVPKFLDNKPTQTIDLPATFYDVY